MLYIQDKDIKVAGKYLPGQVSNISVSEKGIIQDKKAKKSKKKLANQPAGYEAAEVRIEMLFEESKTYTARDMVQYIQRIFKKPKQKKQKKYRIVEPQVNARGVTEVYFNGFETQEKVGESWFTGTLDFIAPKIAGVKIVKTKKAKAAAKAKSAKAKSKKKAAASKKKSKKSTKKSPAKDTKNVKKAKSKAKKVVKGKK